MSKVLLITDQHFGGRGDSQVLADFQEKFYKEILFPFIDKHKINEVFDLGDTFDRRKYINFLSLDRAKKMWFDGLRDRNIKLHMIVGNHSIFYKNTLAVNSPDLLLNEYDNITVYSQPKEINVDGLDIVMMPWICSENQAEAFKLMNETKAQVLFGHLEIQGFEMYRGSVIFHGYEKKPFEKFDMVMSGHFHHKSSQGNIHYLGAPYEMTWSDYNDARGFHVFDTSTRDLTYHQNPYKMFHRIVYDDKDKKMEDVVEKDYSKYKNTYIKIIIKNKENPFWFDTIIDKLEKVHVNQIQVVEDHLNLDGIDEEDLVDEAEDTLTILKKSIQSLNISVDLNKLEKLINELYSEALTSQN